MSNDYDVGKLGYKIPSLDKEGRGWLDVGYWIFGICWFHSSRLGTVEPQMQAVVIQINYLIYEILHFRVPQPRGADYETLGVFANYLAFNSSILALISPEISPSRSTRASQISTAFLYSSTSSKYEAYSLAKLTSPAVFITASS